MPLPHMDVPSVLIESYNKAGFWDYIEEKAGQECIEKYWDDFAAMTDAENFHFFREGFILGASLMLELRS